MAILLPVFVLIVGLLIYFAAKTNGELKECGRIMFFCGLLVFLLDAGPYVVKLFR